VALGRRPADVVLRGGRVVDVFTRRVLSGQVVALAGRHIAYLGPDEAGLYGEQTQVHDLEEAFVLPGFIDGHTHMDSLYQCAALVSRALVFGNTTSITETAMIAGALGPEGVDLFCRDAAGLPMRIFFLSPSLTPPFPDLETSAGFDDRAFDRFIARPDVLGLGETYWPAVFNGDERPLYRFSRCQELGKTIEGHAAGARGRNLIAYRAAGVESCHEATTTEGARRRLGLGLAVQIREGYIRREMAQVLPGLDPAELDSGLISLVSDGPDPEELLFSGGLNLLLRKAVSLGVDPLRAVQMLTLNPARHFNLRRLGAVAPGFLADLIVVRDLRDFDCLKVFADGRLVAEAGELRIEVKSFDYPEWTRRSLEFGPVEPAALALPASGREVRVRVVVLAGETITRAEEVDLPVRDGQVRAAPDRDVLKMAHLDRRGRHGPAVGLVKGFGLKKGAVATSLIWDTNNVLVVGVDEADMAAAVNRLRELGGGFVVWAGGRVEAEFPLPLGGIISPADLKTIAASMKRLDQACWDLGAGRFRPFLTLQTLPFTGLPFYRLTDLGLADVRRGELVEVVLG